MSEGAWSSGRLRGFGGPAVIFGFQHEDSSVEASLCAGGGGGRALCIASGGETAMALLAAGAAEVVAVDANPAQLQWVGQKLAALRARRVDWLVEDLSGMDELAGEVIAELPAGATEVAKAWASRRRVGLCFGGVVERRTRLIGPVLRWFSRNPDGLRWRIGWKFLRLGLALGYSARFRNRLPEGWSARLANRLAKALRERPDDPLVLAELGLGFGSAGLPVYAPGSVDRIVGSLDRIHLVHADLVRFLVDRPSDSWAIIALSNIADTMSCEEAHRLYALAAERLLPGGTMIVRSIVHPAGEIPEISGLSWLPIPAECGAVCPVIAVGRKRIV